MLKDKQDMNAVVWDDSIIFLFNYMNVPVIMS